MEYIATATHGYNNTLHRVTCMHVVVEGGLDTRTFPSGTVLRPLVFLYDINDLPDIVKSQIELFVDDCLVYRAIHTFNGHANTTFKLSRTGPRRIGHAYWAHDSTQNYHISTLCTIVYFNMHIRKLIH